MNKLLKGVGKVSGGGDGADYEHVPLTVIFFSDLSYPVHKSNALLALAGERCSEYKPVIVLSPQLIYATLELSTQSVQSIGGLRIKSHYPLIDFLEQIQKHVYQRNGI